MSAEKKIEPHISRRAFVQRAALAAATATCLPGDLMAKTAAPRPSEDASAQEAKLSLESQAEAEAKFQAILRKYGHRLSDAQKMDVWRLVTEGQKPLEDMRAFPLDNSDQPGNVLKLYPDAVAVRRAPSR
jgi:phosphate-selective porin